MVENVVSNPSNGALGKWWRDKLFGLTKVAVF